MIAGSSTEYSTIYTVMKTIQTVTVSCGQNDSVVTFDLAIYKKAKEIQWRYPNEFKHLIIRMGGFHIALNFLSAIGKKFQESGIEDLLMESGLYGSSSTFALLKGKSYNRGVRAHKLIMEALLRLQWKAFGQWVERTADAEQLSSLREDKVQSNLRRSKEAARTGKLKGAFDVLRESVSNLHQRSMYLSVSHILSFSSFGMVTLKWFLCS